MRAAAKGPLAAAVLVKPLLQKRLGKGVSCRGKPLDSLQAA